MQTIYDMIPSLLSVFGNNGFFVEAGAHDGIGDSTTIKLEQAGWNGICVEPSSAFSGLLRSRKCYKDNRCLYPSDNNTVTFMEVSGNAIELSGITSNFYDKWDREGRPHTITKKLTVTLATLLKSCHAPNPFQFLSLDTEGGEYDILKSLDFNKYLPLTILVEYNGIQERLELLRNLLVVEKRCVPIVTTECDLFVAHNSIAHRFLDTVPTFSQEETP